MYVKVLRRYRDKETRELHEAGELVEYESIPRIVALVRGGYVEPLEPLPADAVTEPVTDTLTATVNTKDLEITMDHLKKDPANSEHVVTAADLETNPELVNAGIMKGETITLGPVVTAGFSQVVDPKLESSTIVEGNLTTGTDAVAEATEPPAAKKTGKATKGASKESNKEK